MGELVQQRGTPGIAPEEPRTDGIASIADEDDEDGDEDRTFGALTKNCSKACKPDSCLKYKWFEGGPNVWYLASDRASRWYKVAKDCVEVEPGFTSIATVRSQEELQKLQEHLPSNRKYWLGGIRLGLPVWHWYTDTGRGISLKTIKHFFWKRGEPNSVARIKKCLVLDGQDGWADRFCWIAFPGLCEYRCVDPNDPNNLK